MKSIIFSLGLLCCIQPAAQVCSGQEVKATIRNDERSIELDLGEVAKGTKIRLCVAIKNISKETIRVRHPLPNAATADPCFFMNDIDITLRPKEEKTIIICTNTSQLDGPIQRIFSFICDKPPNVEVKVYSLQDQ